MTARKKNGMKKRKTMRPRDARSHADVCKLRRDNLDCQGFWMLLNGDGTCSVTIARQDVGENITQQINIPRRVFDRFVDWYMRPVKVQP